MAAIFMTCPNSGATVVTGQHVTPADREMVLARGGRFRCPSCHQVHEWTTENVTLSDWPGATSLVGVKRGMADEP